MTAINTNYQLPQR